MAIVAVRVFHEELLKVLIVHLGLLAIAVWHAGKLDVVLSTLLTASSWSKRHASWSCQSRSTGTLHVEHVLSLMRLNVRKLLLSQLHIARVLT